MCKTAQHSGVGHETNAILQPPYLALRAIRRLVVQGDIQKGFVDSQSVLVIDEAQLLELIHEKVHA